MPLKRKRIKLVVEVDLDPIPGGMYSRESARVAVQAILNDRIKHYNPTVNRDPDYDPNKEDPPWM